MQDRLKQELRLIQKKFGNVASDAEMKWVIIKNWPLIEGWNKEQTAVLVQIPPGYPITPPDNFYAFNDLRLVDGRQPGNTTPNHKQANGVWLQFSYHVEKSDWKPHANILQGHNLLTFLEGVSKRLAEAN